MEKLLEFGRRAVALMFAASYARTHASPRDSALRVAGLAYRFMKGEPVEVINEQADTANALREERTKNRQILSDFRKKKEQNHG